MVMVLGPETRRAPLLDLPVNAAGRLQHCFALLGSAAALSGLMVCFVGAVLGRIAWLEPNAEGVPVLSPQALFWGFSVPMITCYVVLTWSNVAQSPTHFKAGPRYARWSAVVGIILAVIFAGISVTIEVAYGSGVRYAAGELLLFFVFVFVFVALDLSGRHAWFQRDTTKRAAALDAIAQALPAPSPVAAAEPAAVNSAEADDAPAKKSDAQLLPAVAHLLLTMVPLFAGVFINFIYPLVIVPMFFAGEAPTRLLICLLVHPIILEAAEAIVRASSADCFAAQFRQGKLTFAQAEDSIIEESIQTHMTKQTMSFVRRLMLLNMGGPVETTLALVAASVEEALSRGFLVLVDTRLRQWLGQRPLEGDDLRLQRLVWMCDANLSAIAEFTAIFTSTFAQVILQPHALLFALGYEAPVDGVEGVGVDVAAAFVLLMLEVTLEVFVDTTAMWAEGEHGIPVTEYFQRNQRLLPMVFTTMSTASNSTQTRSEYLLSACFQFAWSLISALAIPQVLAFSIALYGFQRVPTFATCPASSYVCDCVDQPQYHGWYTKYCAAVANATTFNTTLVPPATPLNDMFANVDGVSIVIALLTGLAMLALIGLSVVFARYRKKTHAVQSIETAHEDLKIQHRLAGARIKRTERENANLKKNLVAAQALVHRVMGEGGGALLDQFKLKYAELDLGAELGMGVRVSVWLPNQPPPIVTAEAYFAHAQAFGVVRRGTYRGKLVAVKTVRTTKVTKITLRKFRSELKVMAPLRHENLVNLVGGCWDSPDELAIVLELCEAGSIKMLIEGGAPDHTWDEPYHRIALGTAKCLQYLHHEQPTEPLIHRDIKPENIMVTDKLCAKIADFGEATRFDEQAAALNEGGGLSMTLVGTPMYIAPEVLRHERYTTAVDVFSYGVTLLVIGHKDSQEHIKKQCHQHSRISSELMYEHRALVPADDFVELHPALWELIQDCCRVVWKERLTSAAVVKRLKDLSSSSSRSTRALSPLSMRRNIGRVRMLAVQDARRASATTHFAELKRMLARTHVDELADLKHNLGPEDAQIAEGFLRLIAASNSKKLPAVVTHPDHYAHRATTITAAKD